MTTLTVFPTDSEHSIPGDFRARVTQTALQVPMDVGQALEKLSIQTADQFVAYSKTFPSNLARMLQWSGEDVVAATAVLVRQLKGYIPQELLDPQPPPTRTYGAMKPAQPVAD